MFNEDAIQRLEAAFVAVRSLVQFEPDPLLRVAVSAAMEVYKDAFTKLEHGSEEDKIALVNRKWILDEMRSTCDASAPYSARQFTVIVQGTDPTTNETATVVVQGR